MYPRTYEITFDTEHLTTGWVVRSRDAYEYVAHRGHGALEGMG